MEQDFGERLRMLRRRRGMTQVDLARAVGITVQTVVRYESLHSHEELRPARLKALAGALDVDTAELAGEGAPEDEEIAVLTRGLRRMDPARRENLIALMMPLIEQYRREEDEDGGPSLS
jgi:transcriptional regulator with XRE-family HTH domain